MKRKALISPGFGAGWSTWNDHREDFLFDPELIAAVEAGKDLGGGHYGYDPEPGTPLDAFKERLKAKYGPDTYAYFGGARDLKVVEIEGEFRVDEYDGSEGITYRDLDNGWI